MNLNELKVRLQAMLDKGNLSAQNLKELEELASSINLPQRNLDILISLEKQKRGSAALPVKEKEVKPTESTESNTEVLKRKKPQQQPKQYKKAVHYQGKFTDPEAVRSDLTGKLLMAKFGNQTKLVKRRDEQDESLLLKEFEQTRGLQHSGLLLPEEQGGDTFGAYLVYPYQPVRLFENVLKSDTFDTSVKVKNFAIKLAQILVYLHGKNMAHAYITPRTLYVNNADEPVLWGVKGYRKKDILRFGTWQECIPPEFPENDPKLTDIYQFGVIVKLLLKAMKPNENTLSETKRLEQIAAKCMKKHKKRIFSAKELLALLLNIENQILITNNKKVMSNSGKSNMPLIIIGAVVVLAIAMVFIFKDSIMGGDAADGGKKKNSKDLFSEYVAKADGYFTAKNVITAKTYYDSAAVVNAEDTHVKERRITCNQIMANVDKLVTVKNAQGKFGYSNTEGYVLIEYVYEDAMKFKDNITAVKLGGKWGFIDKLGNVVIEFRFSAVNETFKPGYKAMVTENGKCIMIDRNGNFVKKCP